MTTAAPLISSSRNLFTPPNTGDEIASLDGVLYFVNERENLRRHGFTSDPILQQYRFCNIRRRDDRVSLWLVDKMYAKANRWVGVDFWLLAMYARLINWPPTLEYLMRKNAVPLRAEDYKEGLFLDTLRSLQADKKYTSAYRVNTASALPRDEHLANIVGDAVNERAALRAAVESNSLRAVVSVFSQLKGVGEFLAGQFAADLTYINGQLEGAIDLNTYAPKGPGSQKGLNYYLGRPVDARWKSAEFCHELAQVRFEVLRLMDWSGCEPTLMDIQSVFCEYAKYARTVLGHGKPKNKYQTHASAY